MKIKLEDIIVNEAFQKSVPQERKLQECRDFYRENGRLDRELVINFANVLIDGYIGYLVLKETGYSGEIRVKQSGRRKKKWYRKGVSVSYKQRSTIYVFGKHHEDGKEFVWRVPETKRELTSELVAGKEVAVVTKYGKKIVTITRIEELNDCPGKGRVKKVIL